METQENTPLPPDIMIEIFLLLPLDSIRSCKLVSKEWNRLVKHPTLTKLYTVESTTFFVSENRLNCLFRNDDNGSYKVSHIPIELNKHRKVLSGDLPRPHQGLLREWSNKIACVKAEDDTFLLYNLITGDSHVVTDAPFSEYTFRFGYDCFEDDYKIMLVCSSRQIFVYSNRNRCWKLLLEGFPQDAYCWPRIHQRQACSFRDVLHWIVTKRDQETRRKVVAALDVHSYGFVEILLPPVVSETLTELDGDLCCSYSLFTFHVWVMKEYGVPESWMKLFSICTSRIGISLYDRITMRCVALYQCRDARKLVVVLCLDSGLELIRYDMGKDQIDPNDVDTISTRMRLISMIVDFIKA